MVLVLVVVLRVQDLSVSGGESYGYNGGETYHVFFTTTGSLFVWRITKLMLSLLIGGGASGGGGDHYGGGGGAGGVVYSQNQHLTPGSYTVYVGPGGGGGYNAQDGNPSFPSQGWWWFELIWSKVVVEEASEFDRWVDQQWWICMVGREVVDQVTPW